MLTIIAYNLFSRTYFMPEIVKPEVELLECRVLVDKETLHDWLRYLPRRFEGVLEAIVFKFRIRCSSVALAQLTRHRTMTFLVESHRYEKYSGGFILPPALESREDVKEFLEKAMELYDRLVSEGVAWGDARYVLPRACTYELELVANLRALVNFWSQRLCALTQLETRAIAYKMYKLALKALEEKGILDELKDILEPYSLVCERGMCSKRDRGCLEKALKEAAEYLNTSTQK